MRWPRRSWRSPREQRISAVGALAAAAAHELGSPLATIAVVAKELAHDIPGTAACEDRALLLSQSERCRKILAELARQPEHDGGSPYTRLPISALVETAGTLHQHDGVKLIFATADSPAPRSRLFGAAPRSCMGSTTLSRMRSNSPHREVSVTTFWDKTTVTVEIADDGPGSRCTCSDDRRAVHFDARRRGRPYGLGISYAEPARAQRREAGLR